MKEETTRMGDTEKDDFSSAVATLKQVSNIIIVRFLQCPLLNTFAWNSTKMQKWEDSEFSDTGTKFLNTLTFLWE